MRQQKLLVIDCTAISHNHNVQLNIPADMFMVWPSGLHA